MRDHILWVDVETTGLDPEECDIIEIACVLTDADLNIQGEYDAFIDQPHSGAKWEAGALGMHADSGLLRLWCDGDKKLIWEAEDEIVTMLEFHEVDRPLLAGHSVHFDRSFLKHNMYEVWGKLHYRNLDVRSIQILFEDRLHFHPYNDKKAHRAMVDIKRSMNVYRYYRCLLKRGDATANILRMCELCGDLIEDGQGVRPPNSTVWLHRGCDLSRR